MIVGYVVGAGRFDLTSNAVESGEDVLFPGDDVVGFRSSETDMSIDGDAGSPRIGPGVFKD